MTATFAEAVDVLASADGHLINDVEGVTLVDEGDGAGYVIVSVQNAPNPNASYFSVYQREPRQRLREDLPGRERHVLGRL